MTRVWTLGILVLLAGCTDEGTVGTPFNFAVDTTCGGDVVGTWRLLGNTVGGYCPGAFGDYRAANDTYTFANDGTLRYSFAGTSQLTLPASCPANDLGIPPPSCAVFKNTKGATCVDAPGGGCTCALDEAVVQQGLGNLVYKWTAKGSVITLEFTAGGKTYTGTETFCVDGNSLAINNGNVLLFERR